MAATRKDLGPTGKSTRRPPAKTPEARERDLIAAAFDLAERQILDGTAPAMITSHFLKLGSEREKHERKKLQLETELLAAKRNEIESAAKVAELYSQVIEAMSEYQGRGTPKSNDFDE